MIGGSQRYLFDDFDVTHRIRQDKDGNWHTELYLDFQAFQSQHPDSHLCDFLHEECGCTLADWQDGHLCLVCQRVYKVQVEGDGSHVELS